MSRQMQNILMGALACAVAAVAMLAVTLVLIGDDDTTTTASAVDPLVGGISDADGGEGFDGVEGGDGMDGVDPASSPSPDSGAGAAAQLGSRPTLDLAPLASTTTAPTTTSTRRTTTTTAPTTAAPTTSVAPTSTTVDPLSTTETTTPGDSSSSSTETTDGSSESTTSTVDVPDSTNAPSSSVTSTTAVSTTTTAAPTTTAPPTTSGGGGLNDVEREIARLTNELRTNPNGPLKRQGPVINCGGRIRVDGSGGYEAIGALSVHEGASLQVARPWSAQMSRSNFKHRPNAGVGALQEIGVSVRSAGENIAYHNYPDKAMNHFTGWRESDGHFCNMMDPGFTHIGVGEVTQSDGISYATQNFFSTR